MKFVGPTFSLLKPFIMEHLLSQGLPKIPVGEEYDIVSPMNNGSLLLLGLFTSPLSYILSG